MTISILLPYKENYSPLYAGAVSLFVKDITKVSSYKKNIMIFGNTVSNKKLSKNYINLDLNKKIFQSTSKIYIRSFLDAQKEINSDLVEIHNRPNYVKLIKKEFINKLFLFFHNDPLTMNGSKTIGERIYLLDNLDIADIAAILSLFTDTKLNEYHGALIDNSLDNTTYVPFGNLVGYWGFNDEVVNRVAPIDNVIEDRSGYINNGYGKNINYTDGINTTGDFQLPSGTKATLNGTDSYIRVDHQKQLNFFETSDYALSIWTILPTSQSDVARTHNSIVSKRGTEKDYGQNNKGIDVLRRRNVETPIYPFDIEVKNQSAGAHNGKVKISLSNGITEVFTTSSTSINDNLPHHICLNKTGSHLELWVDGIKENTGSLPTSGSLENITLRGISNTYDMLLGSKFDSEGTWDKTSNFGSLSGSLDEFRIYNKGLTEVEIKALGNNDYVTGSAYQTNSIGEVFYKHGIMVISDPRPIYRYVWTGRSGIWDYGITATDKNYSTTGWTTKYKSSKELNEVNILCEIGSDEFNVSQNPTVKRNNDSNSSLLKSFVTGSDFAPYFTTIGLYNTNGDLIAVGKLASAIQNRNDVDLTVKVRLDLDGTFGTPGTGSLAVGSNATVYKTDEEVPKYIWNKLDRPDILVNSNFPSTD